VGRRDPLISQRLIGASFRRQSTTLNAADADDPAGARSQSYSYADASAPCRAPCREDSRRYSPEDEAQVTVQTVHMSDLKEPKAALRHYLQSNRDALPWKLEGLGQRALRMPRTPTGTNLIGIVKHMANVEIGYFGDTFWPGMADARRADLGGGFRGRPAGRLVRDRERDLRRHH
jgi:Protein of unknown function (DUF664)